MRKPESGFVPVAVQVGATGDEVADATGEELFNSIQFICIAQFHKLQICCPLRCFFFFYAVVRELWRSLFLRVVTSVFEEEEEEEGVWLGYFLLRVS